MSHEYSQDCLTLTCTLTVLCHVVVQKWKHTLCCIRHSHQDEKPTAYHVNVCNVNMTVCSSHRLYRKLVICSILNLIAIRKMYSTHTFTWYTFITPEVAHRDANTWGFTVAALTPEIVAMLKIYKAFFHLILFFLIWIFSPSSPQCSLYLLS